MTEQQVKRKLTSILSADVKGYSRLMEDDEEATVRTVTEYREVMAGHITRQNGRVVDAKGDNILAEFASVVDALRCAVKIQKELGKRNDDLPENRRMEFRIGINLGDVIEEKETIYGDGVNIAARLEGLAQGGGVCISGTAFDQIGKKLPLGYEYLGEQSVKNIEKPVRVYRVLMEPEAAGKVVGEEKLRWRQWRWATIGGVAVLIIVAVALAIWNFYFRPPPMEPASVEKMALPLPDKPSIAVLPFVNISGDPKQDYFSDGITEEIISALSTVSDLFVIARNSSFTYKGKAVWVPDVARDLGVRYIVEGSVRMAGDRVRITAQLIDGKTNHHLWSETYDRELKDVFTIQDDVTKKILVNVKVKLTGDAERTLSAARCTSNLKAYLKILEGIHYNFESKFSESIKAFEEAISLDPKCADAYRFLAWLHLTGVWFGPSATRAQSLGRAFEYCEKCLALAESAAGCHSVLGHAYLLKRDYDKAIFHGKRSIELNPNSAVSATFYGWTLRSVGRYEEAVKEYERAMRLDPMSIQWPLTQLGATYVMMRRHEEAIEACRKSVGIQPRDLAGWITLVMAYSSLGRMEEAHAAASEILKLSPNFSVEHFARAMPYKNEGDRQFMADALRKAGMK